MPLPTFLIIGAMKAGTTSLHNYLSMHPEIFMSKEKELDFFYHPKKWEKGIDWYKDQFDENYLIRGETSPNYSKRTEAIVRISQNLSDIKLIYLTRDPIKRFESECNHLQLDPNKLVGSKNLKDTEAYNNSLYYTWYKEYLKYYTKDKILVLKSEDLRNKQSEVLMKIFRFLEVNPDSFEYKKKELSEKQHVTSDKLLATNLSVKLAKYKKLDFFKKNIKKIVPFLTPIYRSYIYKNREMRFLTSENKIKLFDLFKNEMKCLKKEIDIDYGY